MKGKELEHYSALLRVAATRGAKVPMFFAILLVESKELEDLEPDQICGIFGMPESYVHLIRTVQKIPGELQILKKKIV